MKRLILKTANAACVMFAILMACFLVMGYAFAGPSHGLNLAASLYAAAIGITVLQTAWFTDALLKQLSYPARIAGLEFAACRCLRCAHGSANGFRPRWAWGHGCALQPSTWLPWRLRPSATPRTSKRPSAATTKPLPATVRCGSRRTRVKRRERAARPSEAGGREGREGERPGLTRARIRPGEAR